MELGLGLELGSRLYLEFRRGLSEAKKILVSFSSEIREIWVDVKVGLTLVKGEKLRQYDDIMT